MAEAKVERQCLEAAYRAVYPDAHESHVRNFGNGKPALSTDDHKLLDRVVRALATAEQQGKEAGQAWVESADKLARWVEKALPSNDAAMDDLEAFQAARAVGGSSGLSLRASVRWFAEQMELRLRRSKNEAKGGWHECAPAGLLERVFEEANETRDALMNAMNAREFPCPDNVVREAADVANMAMMVADHFRSGGPSRDQGQTLGEPPSKPEGGK